MAIIRWDPFTALNRMDSEFDELVRRSWGATQSAGFVPAVDMVREDVIPTMPPDSNLLHEEVGEAVEAGAAC